MSLTDVVYKHPVQRLDQKCWLKRIGGRVTWRWMIDKAKEQHAETRDSSLHGYLRWAIAHKIAGPCVGADEETLEAFRWIWNHQPYSERIPEDWRGDCDFQDGIDGFWDEAAQCGMNPFWGM